MTKTENMQVAETILEQLGGKFGLVAMCGCKNFIAGDSAVTFQIGSNGKRVTMCQIVLDSDDTYSVKFYRGRSVNLKECYESSGIYADQLKDIFTEQTGMYLSI
jgi:hypothetical protein